MQQALRSRPILLRLATKVKLRTAGGKWVEKKMLPTTRRLGTKIGPIPRDDTRPCSIDGSTLSIRPSLGDFIVKPTNWRARLGWCYFLFMMCPPPSPKAAERTAEAESQCKQEVLPIKLSRSAFELVPSPCSYPVKREMDGKSR